MLGVTIRQFQSIDLLINYVLWLLFVQRVQRVQIQLLSGFLTLIDSFHLVGLFDFIPVGIEYRSLSRHVLA